MQFPGTNMVQLLWIIRMEDKDLFILHSQYRTWASTGPFAPHYAPPCLNLYVQNLRTNTCIYEKLFQY